MATRSIVVPVISLAAGIVIAGSLWLGSAASRSATTEDATMLDLPGPAAWDGITLELRSVVGDVTIEGQPDAQGVRAEVQRIAKARTEPIARQMLDVSRPYLRWNDDQTAVIAGTEQPLDASDTAALTTTWIINVPAGMRISVRNDVGDVTVGGVLGDVSVRTDVGDVTVTGSVDAVTAIVDVGDVRIDTGAAATARSDTGTVWINGAEQTRPVASP